MYKIWTQQNGQNILNQEQRFLISSKVNKKPWVDREADSVHGKALGLVSQSVCPHGRLCPPTPRPTAQT